MPPGAPVPEPLPARIAPPTEVQSDASREGRCPRYARALAVQARAGSAKNSARASLRRRAHLLSNKSPPPPKARGW